MSAFKLLEDYCIKYELPAPINKTYSGTYGGYVGVLEIGANIYKDNQEMDHISDAKERASIIAFRNILKL